MSVERVKVWRCLGCGKVEGLQTCIGVCQDRRAEFVDAADYDALAGRANELATLVRQLAFSTPRDGEWEHSYRALQQRARRVLAAIADAESAASEPT